MQRNREIQCTGRTKISRNRPRNGTGGRFDKDIRRAMISTFYVLRKVEKKSMLREERKDLK